MMMVNQFETLKAMFLSIPFVYEAYLKKMDEVDSNLMGESVYRTSCWVFCAEALMHKR